MRVIARPAFKGQYKNPYTWSLYKDLVSLGVDVDEFSTLRCLKNRYDVFHLHWPEWHLGNAKRPEAIAKTLSLLFLIDLLRAKGAKIIWTVHNLGAHENQYPKLESWFWDTFTKKLDGYISLSHAGKEAANQTFPNLNTIPGFVVPHSHYRGVYPIPKSPEAARQALGISPTAKVMLLFGRIRPYKNVPALVREFRKLKDADAALYIVGSFGPALRDLFDEVKTAAASDPRVIIKDEFVHNDDVHLYFQAADLVVLPYREILNSGSALLALSFNRPILVPELGSLGEIKNDVGEDWVQTYTGDISVEKLERASDWATQAPRSEKAPIDDLSTISIAQKTYDAYYSICNI